MDRLDNDLNKTPHFRPIELLQMTSLTYKSYSQNGTYFPRNG